LKIPLAEQVANVAAMMPMADKLKLRSRVLKLGAFCDLWLDWLVKDVGIKKPLDTVVLISMFC